METTPSSIQHGLQTLVKHYASLYSSISSYLMHLKFYFHSSRYSKGGEIEEVRRRFGRISQKMKMTLMSTLNS